MKLNSISFLFKLLILQYLSIQCLSDDFDFFYFVQQWPGAYCDSNQSCCYPITPILPAEFNIYGLRPTKNDGSTPLNCDIHSVFDKSKISDLIENLELNWPSLRCPQLKSIKLWSHEWMKHGTCSESKLTQHDYFQTALKLKKKLNIIQILENAGIEPDDKFYDTSSILDAIQQATGFLPGIVCNRDPGLKSQLLKVYMCVDTSGSNFIECPGVPMGSCGDTVQFSKFWVNLFC
ncbi:ribonuclease 3 isoform X2 [Medicago truncatula]|uniref:ribonuclease 3 isoform X2 n=1 Tax=Medicago truncatula TaxID=3880 RepID=UPI0019688D57|nr:ribonuclease 3 isoform X2 [Medicago truncatula]